MSYKITNSNYDLQAKRVQISMSSDGPDGGFASVAFNLSVAPHTPESALRHHIEAQAREHLKAAAEFQSV